jgi:Protein of unknown function (DUF2924)
MSSHGVVEALHPQHESLESLRKQQLILGPDVFAAQYMQRPIPQGGVMIRRDWLRYYDTAPRRNYQTDLVLSLDTASKRPRSKRLLSIYGLVLAYRVQAGALGDLDRDCQRILDRANSLKAAGKQARKLGDVMVTLEQGTILSREWNGRMHRVAVLAGGFAWNGKTYPSLSKVASAITGTRWNGPRFFGLRDRSKLTSAAKP